MNVEREIEQEDGGPTPPTSEDLTCHNCAARYVCRVLAGFAPLMADFEKILDQPPVDPYQLAKICWQFAPVKPITVNFEPTFPVDTQRLPEVA